ncbi:PREDICTED: phosphatidylinositol 5-phosphate 4-kinase type-2 beta-like isoform X2 [Priapulus caudatus]|nr:PREDICTED: phosphatidylinositol 5-phosphate 4-kinase type-2 beta-like isoform X2 [Priapulus caudatus]
MPSHFKVKEYCPIVFRNLRERFSVDDTDYMNSLTKSQPVLAKYQGRSGGRILISYDNKFLITTSGPEEVEQMHHILKQYHQHIVENHGQTLLPQYMGMYRLTVEGGETYLIISKNVLSKNLPIHKVYDLKGSTIDRQASEKEKAKDLPAYKDNDFVEEGVKLIVGPEAKEKFMEKLTRDVGFLTNLHLMDYSLLVGIHDCQTGRDAADALQEEYENENGTDAEGSESDNGGQKPTPPGTPSPKTAVEVAPFDFDLEFHPEEDIYGIPGTEEEDGNRKEVYYLALIQVLTEYNAQKRTAHAMKTVKHGTRADISTVGPEQFSRRLLDFVAKVIE